MWKYATANVLLRRSSEDLGDLRYRDYDLVLSALSWESRGTAALQKLGRKFPKLHFLRFSSATNPIANKLKDDQLRDLSKFAETHAQIELDSSTSFVTNVKKIDDLLQEHVIGRR